MKKNYVGYIIGAIFAGLSTILGLLMQNFIIFIVCFILGGIFMSINKKHNEKVIAEEYMKSYNEEMENKRKRECESVEIEKNNDLESVLLNIEFKKKFGLSFLEFKKNIALKDHLYLTKSVNDSEGYIFKVIELNNRQYFILNTEKTLLEKLMFQPEWDEETLSIYKNLTIDDASKLIFSYDMLEYVEYVENIMEFKITRGPSSFDLAVTEELYGTAAAINKANQSIPTEKINKSYIKFTFSSQMNVMPLIYTVRALREENYVGLLKKVWLEKEKNRLINSRLVSKKSNYNDDVSDYNKLRELKKLLDDGIITKEEFEREKYKILNKLS